MDLRSLLTDATDGTPVASLSDAALTQRLLALTEAIDRLTAIRRTVAGEWDQRMVWAGDGARSGTAWLAHNTEMSRARAGAELRVARRLRTMPHLAQASEVGELGAEKVTTISHAVDRDPDGRLTELFAEHEPQLVRDARRLTVDQTHAAVRYWRSCASDTTATLDARAQHAARALRLIPAFDGMVDLEGRLDAIAAAMLDNRLRQVMERNRRAERAALAEGEPGRSATQRRADALVDLVTAAPAIVDNSNDDGSNEAERPLPLLVVDVPLEALEDRSGTPATLPDGTPVAFEALSRLACETGVAGIITRAGRLTVDLGRTSYTPNRGQRRALAKRDGHCIFPGCDAPPAWCDAHHLWPWENGGPTALWNLGLLCRFHQRPPTPPDRPPAASQRAPGARGWVPAPGRPWRSDPRLPARWQRDPCTAGPSSPPHRPAPTWHTGPARMERARLGPATPRRNGRWHRATRRLGPGQPTRSRPRRAGLPPLAGPPRPPTPRRARHPSRPRGMMAGRPARTTVNLESVESASVGVLTERLGMLSGERLQELCRALEIGVGCDA